MNGRNDARTEVDDFTDIAKQSLSMFFRLAVAGASC
jgi:hypothetical protein